MWFWEVIPTLANLMLRLPSLLEAHYHDSDGKFGEGIAGLRIMHHHEPGIVFLSQVSFTDVLMCPGFCIFSYQKENLTREVQLFSCMLTILS